MTTAIASISALAKSSEWSINWALHSVKHKTGLEIRVERSSKHRKAFIDIQNIESLAGTEWAAKANVLIEQGIALIEKGVR